MQLLKLEIIMSLAEEFQLTINAQYTNAKFISTCKTKWSNN